jgi:tRNA threonylcarbamoyl adenosine modification protein YeaZ
VLVLAIDTSTPAITAGLVRVEGSGWETVAARVTVNARAHAEVLTPQILECLAAVSASPADLGAIVVGCGPGPYTGLRVGMATAAAFGDALRVPVYGVCSLDAIAGEAAEAAAAAGAELLVVTDARRREVYWARYRDGVRVDGPAVLPPAEVPVDGCAAVAGSAEHAAMFALPAIDVQSPAPRALVGAAIEEIRATRAPAPLVPLYLRRPDATEPRALRRAVTP